MIPNEVRRLVVVWNDAILRADPRVGYPLSDRYTKTLFLPVAYHADGSSACADNLCQDATDAARHFLRTRMHAVAQGRLLVHGEPILPEQYLQLWLADLSLKTMIQPPEATVSDLAAAGQGVELTMPIPESAHEWSSEFDQCLGDTLSRLKSEPHPKAPGYISYRGWLHREETIFAYSSILSRTVSLDMTPEAKAIKHTPDGALPRNRMQLHRMALMPAALASLHIQPEPDLSQDTPVFDPADQAISA